MIPKSGQTTATVTSGTPACIAIPVAFRGVLNRLVVKQTSGVLAGFTFTVYDRKDACGVIAEDTSNTADGKALVHAEIHQIIPTAVAAASSEASAAMYGVNIPYENMDEQDVYLRRPANYLYVKLTASGTGDKNFALSWTASTDLA